PRLEPDLLAVGVGTVALAVWQGPWFSHTADVFYHVAAVRSVLLKGEPFATLPMYPGHAAMPDPTSSGWHTLLALASAAARLDPADAWVLVHPLAAATPLLALAAAARGISGSRVVGVAAA